MEQCYSFIQKKRMNQMSMKGTSVRYGKEQTFGNEWRRIVEIEDPEIRRQEIDKLLESYEQNSKQNGFWRSDEEIQITFGGGASNAILLDDKSIYYIFFNTLHDCLKHNATLENPRPEGVVVRRVIQATIDAYFGKFNGDMELRDKLTSYDFDQEKTASVANLRGKSCAACVEKASVAHNLFLLTGRESYYVSSCSATFPNSKDEAHAFVFIRNGKGTFVLYDQAMENYGAVPGDPIEKMLNGEPLIIDEPFENPGVYANALNLTVENITEEDITE